jgi:Na+/H+ antiporter NhaD/arsenite permease-like protein
MNFTSTLPGVLALCLFSLAYLFVIAEEVTELRKSIPVVLASSAMWVLVAVACRSQEGAAEHLLTENVLEFGRLFLFLLSAMTFVNTLQERNVFSALRSRLIAWRLSLRAVFWITGAAAFVLSPVLDNLTTALVMGAVAVTMGRGNSGSSSRPASISWWRPMPAERSARSGTSRPSWCGRRAP